MFYFGGQGRKEVFGVVLVWFIIFNVIEIENVNIIFFNVCLSLTWFFIFYVMVCSRYIKYFQ